MQTLTAIHWTYEAAQEAEDRLALSDEELALAEQLAPTSRELDDLADELETVLF